MKALINDSCLRLTRYAAAAITALAMSYFLNDTPSATPLFWALLHYVYRAGTMVSHRQRLTCIGVTTRLARLTGMAARTCLTMFSTLQGCIGVSATSIYKLTTISAGNVLCFETGSTSCYRRPPHATSSATRYLSPLNTNITPLPKTTDFRRSDPCTVCDRLCRRSD